jgi:hypothetical protein
MNRNSYYSNGMKDPDLCLGYIDNAILQHNTSTLLHFLMCSSAHQYSSRLIECVLSLRGAQLLTFTYRFLQASRADNKT